MARPATKGGKRSATRTPKPRSAKSRNSKTRSQKAPSSSNKASRTNSSITDLKKQIERQAQELEQARQQQAASSRVLHIIGGSPGTLKPVFQAIVKNAVELCGARFGAVFKMEGNLLHLVADYNFGATQRQLLGAMYPMVPNWGHISGRAVLTGAVVQIPDIYADKDYKSVEAKKAGFRSLFAAPLLQSGRAIGSIVIYRTAPGVFTAQQLTSLQDFAAQAVIAIENARLFNEVQQRTEDLSEALQQQTATGEVLKVIASSPTDVNPALQAIVESACAFCNAYDAGVLLRVGDELHFSAHHGPIRSGGEPRPIGRDWVVGRSVVDKVPVQVSDFEAPEAAEFPEGQRQSREQGHRCTLSVPLLREGEAIGAIALRRVEPVAFSDKQIGLLQTFADQAVIAIGNVRLFEEVQAKTRELSEALTYQTGSANILRVIASSPTDVAPVLDAIVKSACELCDAYDAIVRLKDGEYIRFGAHLGPIPPVLDEHLAIDRSFITGRAIVDRLTIHLHDVFSAEGDEFPGAREMSQHYGIRTILCAPMLREGESIGAILLRRTEVNPFTDKQIGLLQTFADQAVIAIGNVRLFEEVQAKTRDLEESLQQQTATADVLQVINSSPGHLEPVFAAMLEKATHLCEAAFGILWLCDGEQFRAAALHGVPPTYAETTRKPIRPLPTNPLGRMLRGERLIVSTDVADEEPYRAGDPMRRALVDLAGARSVIQVALVRDETFLGSLTVYRDEVRPFSEKQIALLQNFAAQAVIAMENARLLDELRQSLQQQTATADVLKVISRSAFDLQTVLDTLTESAAQLCNADMGSIARKDERGYYHATAYKFAVDWVRVADPLRMQPGRDSVIGRALLAKKAVQIADVLADSEYNYQDMQRVAGYRTLLGVPLMRQGEPIGALFLGRRTVEPFTDKQVELVSTFADQAVIAIENVRLFDEVQAKTSDLSESLQQQTATADVLKVISRSTFDLQAVLDTLTESAARLCNANMAAMTRQGEAGHFYHVTNYNFPSDWIAYSKTVPLGPGRGSTVGRALLEKKAVQILDVLSDPEYAHSEQQKKAGFRTFLAVPLLRQGEPIGVLSLGRKTVQPFSDKQIQLVSTFADQAVIAIENVNLFEQVQQRTRELSQSLEDLRTAQDRLVQTEKLASLGQLTAGIAHEIKNPLNFVNNFSQLSAELVDEMTEVFENRALDEDSRRKELDEIRELLKSNLEKVVQHGKRADSIVKNMLLHSRDGSGEVRTADINGLVDESLNLAYHGARAEKSGFNITLQRQFDASAGEAELFPQEITRALLNLISNGFYAAAKRKAQNGEASFEPTLSATTKNLGASVEIRIRDNGTGIPPEVKEKMFNPFFTTKPAGEGTGLGLSMTHDIIVKQHGGTIHVDTEPGAFTEFIVTLPRVTGVQNIQRSSR